MKTDTAPLPHIIVIVGPTGAGKSTLAVHLAKKLNGEVVSADSRQVYRGLTIGTEKISAREMQGVCHWCLDIASPRRAMSVVSWQKHAHRAIHNIIARGKVPIIAGGTGLYVDALISGITFPEVSPNHTLRTRLAKKNAEELFSLLQKKDPVRAHTIDPHNPRRLIRALEIAEACGASPAPTATPTFRATLIGIFPPFSLLEKKLHARLKKALARGLVRETAHLREIGLSWKRIDELGLEYRIVAQFLRGELPKEKLLETLFTSVRSYAKRQLVWWKHYKTIQRYDSLEEAKQACKDLEV